MLTRHYYSEEDILALLNEEEEVEEAPEEGSEETEKPKKKKEKKEEEEKNPFEDIELSSVSNKDKVEYILDLLRAIETDDDDVQEKIDGVMTSVEDLKDEV